MSESPHPRVALVGAGALAHALGPVLRREGFSVPVVVSRSMGKADSLARMLDSASSVDLHQAVVAADWICCCVPDDALDQVAEKLDAWPGDWTGKAVMHTSGAVSSTVFDRIAVRGAATLSFHPVQTFAGAAMSWRGISIGIEGSAEGLRVGRRLALALGARPFEIATDDKALYHAAAAIASNGVVTLVSVASEMLSACNIPVDRGLEVLRPLIAGTLQNLQEMPPEQALSGPVVRGDALTVTRHLAAVEARTAHLLPTVGALVTETVRLAVRSGRLDAESAISMLDRVADALGPEAS